MKTHALNAEMRTVTGKNECNRLRQKGFIPAVMYSHGKGEKIMVLKKEFGKLFKSHISESVLIDLNISGGAEPVQKVIVKDYQLDPVTDDVLHLDFYKITADEKLHTMVQVVIIGTSKGERNGGILEVLERELEVESLPADLPEKIELDVTNIELGHSIHIKDLPVTGSVKYLGDPNRAVIAVIAPKQVKEEVPAEAVEGEAVAEEAKEEKEEE
jgi:large subunit ribosomal protein L25